MRSRCGRVLIDHHDQDLIFTIPFFGWLGDRFGSRRIYALGGLLLALMAVPIFLAIGSASLLAFTVAVPVALAVNYASMFGPQSDLYGAQFPAELRYTGMSLGIQIATAVGGGLAPIVDDAHCGLWQHRRGRNLYCVPGIARGPLRQADAHSQTRRMMIVITLYDHPRSGNCHKVRLLLSVLRLPHQSAFVDVLSGVNQESWFVALNPLRQIPVLTDGNFTIQDSQAILTYLARRYGPNWLADDAQGLARIAEWLSFSTKEIAIGLQASRLFFIANEGIDIAAAQKEGQRVLTFLDEILSGRSWLCLDRPTIADLACFPYVGLAREGRLPLDDHAHVLRWIERIVHLPGYVAMKGLPPPPANS